MAKVAPRMLEVLWCSNGNVHPQRRRRTIKRNGYEMSKRGISHSSYLQEILSNWRAVLAGGFGIGFGAAISNFTQSLFGPYLIKAFGWSREDFALTGTLSLLLLVMMPLAGMIADRFGIRRTALIGIAGVSASYLLFARMSGSIAEFWTIYVVWTIVGSLTTPPVYTRLVAERLTLARGLGLSLVVMGAPVVGVFATPFLGHVIGGYGWRAGYLALAGLTALGGLSALVLIPGGAPARPSADRSEARGSPGVPDYRSKSEVRHLVGQRIFWLIASGMFLAYLPHTLALTQLSLLLQAKGAAGQSAAWIVAMYPLGALIGRVSFGVLLDRRPPHLVSAAGVGIPAAGFVGILFGLDQEWLLAGSVLLIGVASGADGDVAGFLVAKHFGIESFSLTIGLVMAAISAAVAIGSLLLSLSLRLSGGYELFLASAALVSLSAALLLAMTGGRRAAAARSGKSADPALS
jgi:MFS family permease